jgi:hypothetical protein
VIRGIIIEEKNKMQTITKQYKVFDFNELNEDIQEKVVNENYEINVDYEWYKFCVEDFKEYLKKNYGLEFDKVYFNLEYRYRHLSFDKICIADINKFIKGFKKDNIAKSDKNFSYKITKLLRNDEIRITFDKQYYAGGKEKNIISYSDYSKNAITDKYKYLEGLQEWFNEKIIEELLKILSEEFEYLTSKESIVDTINANEFKFLENGERF